jgi:hypothetical protein
MASVHKRTIPTERPPLVSEVSANFLRIEGCHVVSVTNPYGRILGFLDRSRYSSVALSRLSGPRSRPTSFLVVSGIEPGTSGKSQRSRFLQAYGNINKIYYTHEDGHVSRSM